MTRPTGILEGDWQRQVTDLAEVLGYQWVHFRPAQTRRGWRTPVEGPLGEGWPDLVLVGRGRVVFVELKRAGADPTLAQTRVLDALRDGGAEAYTWRPSDLEAAALILRG